MATVYKALSLGYGCGPVNTLGPGKKLCKSITK